MSEGIIVLVAGAFPRTPDRTRTCFFSLLLFFLNIIIHFRIPASRKASAYGTLLPSISIREVRRVKKKTKKKKKKNGKRTRKLDFPHSKPVTYLFCKDAFFCTNNKAAIH